MEQPLDSLQIPWVVAINISKMKGVPKAPITSAEFITEFGLKGDAHGGSWHRQVSLLAQESIDRMASLGVPGLTPGRFAENITTQNLALHQLKIGTKLTIGDVVLEVTQIGKECHRHCAIYHQVGKCAMPTEGIFARVLQGGTITPGMTIRVLE